MHSQLARAAPILRARRAGGIEACTAWGKTFPTNCSGAIAVRGGEVAVAVLLLTPCMRPRGHKLFMRDEGLAPEHESPEKKNIRAAHRTPKVAIRIGGPTLSTNQA